MPSAARVIPATRVAGTYAGTIGRMPSRGRSGQLWRGAGLAPVEAGEERMRMTLSRPAGPLRLRRGGLLEGAEGGLVGSVLIGHTKVEVGERVVL